MDSNRSNEQVRRNIDKFPEHFMFQLTKEEFSNLKSQIATSNPGWGGRRKIEKLREHPLYYNILSEEFKAGK
ncbi:MAG: ORF6N domain-containing protein [Proteobacteria bacterium]|nr:ORF6N domain-containing protein [Pseudomonadota bacterium]MBU4257622.1 ORF6N domain-containing protein [Patescibacteria group bacterium]